MVEMDGAVGVGGGGQAPAPAPHPRLWRLVDERCDPRALETDYVRRFHRHEPREHQCSSAVAKHIKAPVHLVSAPLNLFLFFHAVEYTHFGCWCCFVFCFLASGSRRPGRSAAVMSCVPMGFLISLLRFVWSRFGVLMRLSLIGKDADLVQSHRCFGPFLQSGTSRPPDLEAVMNWSLLFFL